MSKRNFAAGVLLEAGSVIGLLALLFFAMPYVYPYTENSNCVMKNKPECVRYLIEHDANIHLKDAFG